MNELQQCILNLFKHFLAVCKQLDLSYYLVCGSALGAAKYEGFIPWDDDIDIGLPRAEYERFIAHAQALLPEHIFLQNYKTDSAFPHPYSKLRDSSTTMLEEGVTHLDINHGVYIDIFPLDGYPTEESEIRLLRRKKKKYLRQIYCTLQGGHGSLKVRLRNRVFRLLGYHRRTAQSVAALERVLSAYPTENSPVWCNHGNYQGELEYAPREQYGQGTMARFEGLEVVVPQNIDAYLTQKYGDWRSDPPPDRQKSHHRIVEWSVTTSYRDRLRQ